MFLKIIIMTLVVSNFIEADKNIQKREPLWDSKTPGNLIELSQDWSFIVTIVYGHMAFCSGAAISEIWAVTVAHCVAGDYRHDNELRFGKLFVRIGPARIQYLHVKEVEIQHLDDADYYVPIVTHDNLLEILKVVIHPGFMFKISTTRLPYIGIHDIALVKIESSDYSPTVPLTSSPNFYGKCIAAGWALSASETPATHDLYELQFYIGNSRQCKIYFDISSQKLPPELEKLYRKNKMCALVSNNESVSYGVEEGDEGGPLVCSGKIQGIISHFYERANGDYFSFFYDLGLYLDWIKNEIFEGNQKKLVTESFLIPSSRIVPVYQRSTHFPYTFYTDTSFQSRIKISSKKKSETAYATSIQPMLPSKLSLHILTSHFRPRTKFRSRKKPFSTSFTWSSIRNTGEKDQVEMGQEMVKPTGPITNPVQGVTGVKLSTKKPIRIPGQKETASFEKATPKLDKNDSQSSGTTLVPDNSTGTNEDYYSEEIYYSYEEYEDVETTTVTMATMVTMATETLKVTIPIPKLVNGTLNSTTAKTVQVKKSTLGIADKPKVTNVTSKTTNTTSKVSSTESKVTNAAPKVTNVANATLKIPDEAPEVHIDSELTPSLKALNRITESTKMPTATQAASKASNVPPTTPSHSTTPSGNSTPKTSTATIKSSKTTNMTHVPTKSTKATSKTTVEAAKVPTGPQNITETHNAPKTHMVTENQMATEIPQMSHPQIQLDKESSIVKSVETENAEQKKENSSKGSLELNKTEFLGKTEKGVPAQNLTIVHPDKQPNVGSQNRTLQVKTDGMSGSSETEGQDKKTKIGSSEEKVGSIGSAEGKGKKVGKVKPKGSNKIPKTNDGDARVKVDPAKNKNSKMGRLGTTLKSGIEIEITFVDDSESGITEADSAGNDDADTKIVKFETVEESIGIESDEKGMYNFPHFLDTLHPTLYKSSRRKMGPSRKDKTRPPTVDPPGIQKHNMRQKNNAEISSFFLTDEIRKYKMVFIVIAVGFVVVILLLICGALLQKGCN